MLDNFDGGMLERLKLLYAALRYGSLSKAANAVHLSASAVSRQIRQLEEDLGYTLMERHSSGVRATDKGKDLYEKAEKLFAAFEEILGPARAHEHSRYAGRVYILSTPVASQHLLCNALPFIHGLYPEISFEIKATTGILTALGELLSHAWHFAIASNNDLSPALSFIPLFTTEIFLVSRKGDKIPDGISEDPSLLAEVPLIGMTGAFAISRLIEKSCLQFGINPVFQHMAPTMSFQLHMVRAGLGCAIMDSTWVHGREDIQSTPIKAFPKRTFGIIQRANAYQPPHVAVVIDTLVRRFSQMPS